MSRGETYNDNLEGENIIKAKQLMDDTIAQLYEHKKKVSINTVYWFHLPHVCTKKVKSWGLQT